MATEIKIGEDDYLINRLSGEDQFHVFRRVAPIMRGLGEGFASLPPEVLDKGLGELSEGDTLRVFGPMMDALADMEDAKLNYIIHKCMAKVQIKVSSGWANVMPRPGLYQFQDKMDMQTIFRLVLASLQENGIMGFFTESPGLLLSTEGFQSQ